MDDRDADLTAPTEDPLLRAMRVERVIRPDGRYLLYYAWPGDPEVGADTTAATPKDPSDV